MTFSLSRESIAIPPSARAWPLRGQCRSSRPWQQHRVRSSGPANLTAVAVVSGNGATRTVTFTITTRRRARTTALIATITSKSPNVATVTRQSATWSGAGPFMQRATALMGRNQSYDGEWWDVCGPGRGGLVS